MMNNVVRSSRVLSCLGLFFLAGCAWEDGTSFATLLPAVEARWSSSAARDAGDGWQKLSSEFQVQLSAARMKVGDFSVLDSGSPGAGFDPANPPAGYGLCHNGHCHREDGALIPYDEIAASLPGGSPPRVVVTLPFEASADLLSGVEQPLGCEPSCELDALVLSNVAVPLRELTLEGLVRDSRTPSRISGSIPFRYEAIFQTPIELLGQLGVPADRTSPPVIELSLVLEPGPQLLDPVDWSALGVDAGRIDLDSTHNPSAFQLVGAALTELPIHTAVDRRQR